MSEKQQKTEKRKRGRPEKIIPGIPLTLDELAKAMFAPVREKKAKTDQYVKDPKKDEDEVLEGEVV